MAGRAAGAPRAVKNALGWDSRGPRTRESPGVQVARCHHCGGDLRFTIGAYGQSLEQCDTGGCAGSEPHALSPDSRTPPKRGETDRRQGGHAPSLRRGILMPDR